MSKETTIILSTQIQEAILKTKNHNKNLKWLYEASNKLSIEKKETLLYADNTRADMILVNPTNISSHFINYIKKNTLKNYFIFDLTISIKQKTGQIFHVNDHINKSGYNPLVGKQSFYKIDFLDIANLYIYNQEGVITHCCGKKLSLDCAFPNHYLHSISIMLKVFNCQKINAKLVNVYE
tara:strand:- start:249 stop:788 length:540 start_codon:yes stop_codon:yes gene_type:complete